MEIEIAQELGLCFGVRRAIKLLKEAASKYGRIETLGPVAHNQQLIQELTKGGVKIVEDLDRAQNKILAITTHGVSPEVLSEIGARGIHIIDTTCPIVRRAQNAARELAHAGFDVIIFGEAKHSEVKGLLGWAGNKSIAALDVKQIVNYEQKAEALSVAKGQQSDKRRPSPHYPLLGRGRLGVISQTTQSQSAFVEFTTQLVAAFYSKLKEIRIVDTLCRTIRRRQEAAIRLAKRSELMIVIGSSSSANTRHLAELCSNIVETHLVESPLEANNSWLTGKHRIGITTGASTPDEAIEELVAKLKSL